MGRLRSESNPLQPAAACLSRSPSSPSPSSDTNLSVAPWASFAKPMDSIFATSKNRPGPPNLDLQLLTKASSSLHISGSSTKQDSTQLQLSIGSSEIEMDNANVAIGTRYSPRGSSITSGAALKEQLREAMVEKAHAEVRREQAKRQRELAEHEFSKARRIRQQALTELEKAEAVKEEAARQVNATVLQITCHSCKERLQEAAVLRRQPELSAETSCSFDDAVGLSYISAALKKWEMKKK